MLLGLTDEQVPEFPAAGLRVETDEQKRARRQAINDGARRLRDDPASDE